MIAHHFACVRACVCVCVCVRVCVRACIRACVCACIRVGCMMCVYAHHRMCGHSINFAINLAKSSSWNHPCTRAKWQICGGSNHVGSWKHALMINKLCPPFLKLGDVVMNKLILLMASVWQVHEESTNRRSKRGCYYVSPTLYRKCVGQHQASLVTLDGGYLEQSDGCLVYTWKCFS